MKKILTVLLLIVLILPTGLYCPKAAVYAGTNLLKNEDFSDMTNGYPSNWNPGPTSGWEENPNISADISFGYSGTSIKLHATQNDAYIYQGVRIAPGTRYELSVRVYLAENAFKSSKPMRFKLEFNSTDTPNMSTSNILPTETGKWVHKSITFTAPTDATTATVYCRLYENGTAWIDDFTLVPLEEKKVMNVTCDQYFYYPETESGCAKAELLNMYKDTHKNGTVDFALKNPEGEMVASVTDKGLLDGIATFEFPISPLRDRKKEAFRISVTLKSQGVSVYTAEKEVYCYPRPTQMTKDGFLQNEDGSLFVPTLGYHTNGSREGYESVDKGNVLFAEECKAMGMNFLQLSTGAASMYYHAVKHLTSEEEIQKVKDNSLLKAWLDLLSSLNMKGLVCLYEGMEAAGHPQNIEMTKRVVNDFMNHPAVGAWAVMDEPFDMLSDPEYWLMLSYKAVRDLDDKHPVFFVDNSPNIRIAAAFCDMVGADPYISYPMVASNQCIYENYPTCGNNPAAYPGECMRILRQTAERYGKGYLALNQAYRYNGYTPALSELRSFWYQSIFEGANGAGWYEVLGADGILSLEKEKMGYQTYLKTFAEEEQLVATELFGRNSRYPVFNLFQSHHFAYKGVVKNGDLYLLIMNRKAEKQEITIPLTSQNGLCKVWGMPEELYLVGESVHPRMEENILSVSMPSASVSIIRIPCAITSAQRLSLPCFMDISSCDEETIVDIECLYRQDVLSGSGERKFSPSQPVTRGEFAKALIRALALETMTDRGQMAESFDDVLPEDSWYREVRIGRSLNVFRGTGDNKFLPEALLTKGEAEVLCRRALSAANAGDNGLSMIFEGLSGNTATTISRAETARILVKLRKFM